MTHRSSEPVDPIPLLPTLKPGLFVLPPLTKLFDSCVSHNLSNPLLETIASNL